MKYIVIKPFNDITGFKIPGEFIELDDVRASKLRVHGLIGGEYKGNIEKSVKDDDVKIAELEELTGIYPESKQYANKLSDAKKSTKKVK